MYNCFIMNEIFIMTKTDIIIYFLKIFVMNIYVYYVFRKLANIKEVKLLNNVIILFSDFIITLVYMYIEFDVSSLLSMIITCLLYGCIFSIITTNKIGYTIVITTISYAICSICLVISVLITYYFYKIIDIQNKYFNLFCIIIINFILLYIIVKIKKIKNGLNFLNEKFREDFADIVLINISIAVILITCLLGTIFESIEEIRKNLLITFCILGFSMFLMVYKTLTMYYKQKLLKDTLINYQNDIKQQNLQIQDLEAEKYNISKITHEFYNRQKALEMFVKENMKTETAEELSLLNKIQDLTNEYSQKMKDIKTLPELELTGIQEIDNMFKYMQKECYDNNIEFNLKISGNIYHLVNNIIPKNKLETMIGDHIRDAIIAVNSSKNNNREIFVILGVKDKKYELCIYDTGIEFEIGTLVKLGTKPITTHKDTGGSGIGFMTTFETLNQTKASLIIKENPPTKENHYTKAVIIRFDNLNQYKICSYRADEIEKNKKGRNIVIEKI